MGIEFAFTVAKRREEYVLAHNHSSFGRLWMRRLNDRRIIDNVALADDDGLADEHS
ncbi:MAG: hypothetical protein JOZ23_02715 [Mycobacterium sp.]|nr:hypothetical protein [Mycobacterium sp.]